MTTQRKIYRFALYGLSSSGKTCILAALAMARVPNHEGYSCTWKPLDRPIDAKNKNQRQEVLRKSKEWVQNAVDQLAKGEVPEPNPTGAEHFVFECEFTTPQGRSIPVEIIDYSGELLNPALSDSELSHILRRTFSEVDGILVLAEAPYRNQLGHRQGFHKTRDGRLFRDLSDMQQAFTLLRGQKQEGAVFDVPVALLINKWDRYSQIDFTNPQKESEKLEALFNESPPRPHKGLRDVLKNSVMSGDFQAFPMSALGPSCFTRGAGNVIAERPTQANPLYGFGLENPFVWLAERRDAIDLAKYQQAVTSKQYDCKQAGDALTKRFHPDSAESKRAHNLLAQCSRQRLIRDVKVWGGTTLLLSVIIFGGETAVDVLNYRKIVLSAKNPQATDQVLDHAENWLVRYAASTQFRHMITKRGFLKLSEAEKTLYDIQTRREEILWQRVENTPTVDSTIQATQAYLTNYPYGQHATEANTRLLHAQQQQGIQATDEILKSVEAVLENDINAVPESDLQPLLDKLSKTQNYQQSDEQRSRRATLSNQITNRLSQLSYKKDWGGFVEVYHNMMDNRQFVDAANLLANRQPETDDLTNLRAEFKTQVISRISDEVTRAINDGRFTAASNILDIYKDIPVSLKTASGDQAIANIDSTLAAKIDESLYGEVVKYKDSEHAKAYLNQAPLKTMSNEVSAYQAYLEALSSGQALALRLVLLKIDWKDVSGNDNQLDLFVNEKHAGTKHDIEVTNGGTSQLNIAADINAKPNDPLAIKIVITEADLFLDWTDYNINIAQDASVRTLAENGIYSVDLKHVGIARFKLEGYPQAPVLPAWRKPQ